MPVIETRIRNSPQKFLCLFILLIIFCVAIVILHLNLTTFIEVVDSIKDSDEIVPTLLGLCIGLLTVIVLSTIIHLVLIFVLEDFLNGKNCNISHRLWKYLMVHETLIIVVLLDILACFAWLCFVNSIKLNAVFIIISASTLFACMLVWLNYDDVDVSSAQNVERSIGAFWACGAYMSFYEKILVDMPNRMTQFEEKEGITLLVKKLIIICPLSCNANGCLASKDGEISYFGKLKDIIVDEGANNNRPYKTNVYKICGQFYVAAEIPSPLATLYGMRDTMDAVILNYHRECFIQTLKDLLKSYQCIILEYDDLNSSEPLHSFLLSKLEVKKFVDVIK